MANTTDRREVVISISPQVFEGGQKATTAKDILAKNFGSILKAGNLNASISMAKQAQFTKEALATYGIITTARNAIGTVWNQARYSVQRNMQLVDDYIMERQIDEIFQSLNVAKGIASGAIIGAVGGASLGPVGMVIGATIGAGAGIAKQFNTVYQNQDQANLALAQSTYNNTYSRSRMGYALTDNGVNTYN